jgi:hypothetical protein
LLTIIRNKELEEMAAQQEQAQAQIKINENSTQDAKVEYGGNTVSTNEVYDNNLLELVIRIIIFSSNFRTQSNNLVAKLK